MSSNPKEERTTTEELPKAAPFPGDLRDWFAGQALTGILANPGPAIDISTGLPHEKTAKTVASFAYQFADSMMKEREK